MFFSIIFDALLRKSLVCICDRRRRDVLGVGCCLMVTVVRGEVAEKRKKEEEEGSSETTSFLIKNK